MDRLYKQWLKDGLDMLVKERTLSVLIDKELFINKVEELVCLEKIIKKFDPAIDELDVDTLGFLLFFDFKRWETSGRDFTKKWVTSGKFDVDVFYPVISFFSKDFCLKEDLFVSIDEHSPLCIDIWRFGNRQITSKLIDLLNGYLEERIFSKTSEIIWITDRGILDKSIFSLNEYLISVDKYLLAEPNEFDWVLGSLIYLKEYGMVNKIFNAPSYKKWLTSNNLENLSNEIIKQYDVEPQYNFPLELLIISASGDQTLYDQVYNYVEKKFDFRELGWFDKLQIAISYLRRTQQGR